MLAVVVRPYERRPSPATKSPISTAASVSPRASSIGLPVSSRDDLGGLLATVAQAQRELAHDLAALDGRSLRPGRLSGARRRDRRVDVGRARARDAAEDGPVCRPQLLEPLPRDGRNLALRR